MVGEIDTDFDMRALVTGVAGFIGMHLARRLLARGDEVVGIDNLDPYYDVQLKMDRLQIIGGNSAFRFINADISDRQAMDGIFSKESVSYVINLAGQAGVRHSIDNPHAYVQSNLVGFLNILEGCRYHGIRHLVYASSSSVYGGNTRMPFSERDCVAHPVSIYAATKRANELMAHTYSHLYGLPTSGLRLFTVYGPWGRPDMALFKFTRSIIEGNPIDVYNYGRMARDFTYIDDIVDSIVRVLDKPATSSDDFDPDHPDPATARVPFRIFNVGNQEPVDLMQFIAAIENAVGRVAVKRLLPLQDGDVPSTHADVEALEQWTGFRPGTPVDHGVRQFVHWYRDYYKV